MTGFGDGAPAKRGWSRSVGSREFSFDDRGGGIHLPGVCAVAGQLEAEFGIRQFERGKWDSADSVVHAVQRARETVIVFTDMEGQAQIAGRHGDRTQPVSRNVLRLREARREQKKRTNTRQTLRHTTLLYA